MVKLTERINGQSVLTHLKIPSLIFLKKLKYYIFSRFLEKQRKITRFLKINIFFILIESGFILRTQKKSVTPLEK